MATLGTTNTLVRMKNVTVKIAGDTMAKNADVTAVWGNEIVAEPLIGTDIPEFWTGNFGGTIIIEYNYSTDINITTYANPSSGAVPSTSMTLELLDTQGTPKTDTWTISAKLNRPELIVRASNPGTRVRWTGAIVSRPTRSQA